MSNSSQPRTMEQHFADLRKNLKGLHRSLPKGEPANRWLIQVLNQLLQSQVSVHEQSAEAFSQSYQALAVAERTFAVEILGNLDEACGELAALDLPAAAAGIVSEMRSRLAEFLDPEDEDGDDEEGEADEGEELPELEVAPAPSDG